MHEAPLNSLGFLQLSVDSTEFVRTTKHQVLCSHSWQAFAHFLSLHTRLIPIVLGFSWPFWGLYKQFIQITLKLMGTFSAQWDMKEAKRRNLTGQKIQLYISSRTALEVTIWISLEQEVKASLSETITFVKSASQAASGFSCSFPPVLATICPAKKTQQKINKGEEWLPVCWSENHWKVEEASCKVTAVTSVQPSCTHRFYWFFISSDT